MKRILCFVVGVVLLSSCGTFKNLDSAALASAGVKAATAATITDAQIIELSRQSVEYMDAENKVLTTGPYAERLARLTKDIKVEGLTLNFKVYQTSEINAFACGDGSIRVYSGLMDVMDDDQLIAIIGHEIGHVMHADTKAAMKRAYMSSAARDAISSVGGTVAALSQSVLGDLAEQFVSAQFSQKQEYNADAYGFQFAVDNGHDKYSMYRALNKLVELGGASASQSKVQKWFSSHPDSGDRAAKVKAMADTLK